MIAFTRDVKRGFRTNIRIVNTKHGTRTVGMTPYENRLHILTRSLTDAQARPIVFDGACPEHSQSLTDPQLSKQTKIRKPLRIPLIATQPLSVKCDHESALPCPFAGTGLFRPPSVLHNKPQCQGSAAENPQANAR